MTSKIGLWLNQIEPHRLFADARAQSVASIVPYEKENNKHGIYRWWSSGCMASMSQGPGRSGLDDSMPLAEILAEKVLTNSQLTWTICTKYSQRIEHVYGVAIVHISSNTAQDNDARIIPWLNKKNLGLRARKRWQNPAENSGTSVPPKVE